jgi:hypothetical protein
MRYLPKKKQKRIQKKKGRKGEEEKGRFDFC